METIHQRSLWPLSPWKMTSSSSPPLNPDLSPPIHLSFQKTSSLGQAEATGSSLVCGWSHGPSIAVSSRGNKRASTFGGLGGTSSFQHVPKLVSIMRPPQRTQNCLQIRNDYFSCLWPFHGAPRFRGGETETQRGSDLPQASPGARSPLGLWMQRRWGESVGVEGVVGVEEKHYVLGPLPSYLTQSQSPCQEKKAVSFPFPR